MTKKPGRPVAYKELADKLRSSIAKNGDADGNRNRLPTEAELSARYGLSRQTVRRAYQDLVAEGAVHRVAGRGTFAVPPGPYVRSLGSLEDLLAQSNDTELELLSPLHVIEPAPLAVGLILGAEAAMRARMRRMHGGLPFSVTDLYFPIHVGKRLARFKFLTEPGPPRMTTVLKFLDRVLDSKIVLAKQDVTVANAPAEISPFIDLKPSQPVLRIERVFFDGNQQAVEYTVNYFNPARYSYRLELKRSPAR